MNNYLDQLATKDIRLPVQVVLEPITQNGAPDLLVQVNGQNYCYQPAQNLVTVNTTIHLLDNFSLLVSMTNKHYSEKLETAVIVSSITVDGHELTNWYSQCAEFISYQNDQNVDYRGFYLGFNGVWCFELDRPFYQWWHVVSGQGWLLAPAPVRSI